MKHIKFKTIFLIICVVLSNCAFAAVISDNDGSAFVTKGEFDALKESFKSQVDNYNVSIDNKIDGAIASYLSGMSLNNVVKEDTYCKNIESIASAVGDDTFPWVEGDMSLLFYAAVFERESDHYAYSSFRGKRDYGGVKFKERLVEDVDYATGDAKWVGYAETLQNLVANGFYINTNMDGTQKNSSASVSYREGWWSYANSRFNDLTAGTLIEFQMRPHTTGSDQSRVTYSIDKKYANLSRTYESDDLKNTYINCYDGSYTASRFSNVEYRDFCNDTEITGHTECKEAGNIFTNATSSPPFIDANISYNALRISSSATQFAGSSQNYVIANWNWDMYAGTPKTTTSFYKPYIGFVPTTSWGQLYTDVYDVIAKDVVTKHSGTSHRTIGSGADMVYHLNLDAGTPLFKVDKAGKYSITLSFTDPVDHGVWFRFGGFTHNVRAHTETTNLPVNNTAGVVEIAGSNHGYEVASGTEVTFEFEFTNADVGKYVFTTWTDITDPDKNNWHGGGVLKTPPQYSLEIA